MYDIGLIKLAYKVHQYGYEFEDENEACEYIDEAFTAINNREKHNLTAEDELVLEDNPMFCKYLTHFWILQSMKDTWKMR